MMVFFPAKEQYNSDHGRVYFCLVTKGSILSMYSIDARHCYGHRIKLSFGQLIVPVLVFLCITYNSI